MVHISYVMNKRRLGVSPLIAAVLMIAFSMAIAAILMAWGSTFFQEQTDSVGNQSGELVTCSSAHLDIFSSSHNTNWANVTVENIGRETFSNISVISQDDIGSILGKAYIGNLEPGGLAAAQIKTGGTEPEQVRAASQNCPERTASKTFG